MNDEALAKVMTALEREIGSDRLSALRREAARTGVTLVKLLGDAVASYTEQLIHPQPTKAA